MTVTVEQETQTSESVFSQVRRWRTSGNDAYRTHDFPESVAQYKRALALLMQPPVACTAEGNAEAVILRCNLAAALLKLGQPADAAAQCDLALASQPRHPKALFRRAEARLALGKLSEALSDAEAARVVAPADAAVANLMYDIENAIAAAPAARRTQQQDETAAVTSQQWEPDETLLSFAEECMSDVYGSFMDAGAAATQLRLLHVTPDGGRTYGHISLDGAFASASALHSALAFVRGQHTTAFAQAAVLVVDRADVVFPCVWFAGTWPEELPFDARGVFVQLISRGGARTWFLHQRGSNNTMLDPKRELPDDCRLVDDVKAIFADARPV